MSKGGIWWFFVFAGTIAAAACVRFVVNGGLASGGVTEKLLYSFLGLASLFMIVYGLKQVIAKGRRIELENEKNDDLRIT